MLMSGMGRRAAGRPKGTTHSCATCMRRKKRCQHPQVMRRRRGCGGVAGGGGRGPPVAGGGAAGGRVRASETGRTRVDFIQ